MVQSLSQGLTSSRAAAAAVARGGRGLWLWLAIVVVLAGKRFGCVETPTSPPVPDERVPRSSGRSPGAAGQLGDAAGRGRGPRGDRGLLDDHPAATLALRWAAAQRTAPSLAPNSPGADCAATGLQLSAENPSEHRARRRGGRREALLVPEDPRDYTRRAPEEPTRRRIWSHFRNYLSCVLFNQSSNRWLQRAASFSFLCFSACPEVTIRDQASSELVGESPFSRHHPLNTTGDSSQERRLHSDCRELFTSRSTNTGLLHFRCF